MFRVTTVTLGTYATVETTDVTGFCQRHTGTIVRVERV